MLTFILGIISVMVVSIIALIIGIPLAIILSVLGNKRQKGE